MAFVINKIGPLYSQMATGAKQVRDDVMDAASGAVGGLFGHPDFKVSGFLKDSKTAVDEFFGKDTPDAGDAYDNNLKVDKLETVLVGDEKDAVVLEEYVSAEATQKGVDSFYEKLADPFKKANSALDYVMAGAKTLLNPPNVSNAGLGRFFVFVEYRDDNQARRGIHGGNANMIYSTRGPIKFTGQQNLPDVSMPGAGQVIMDMGPGDSYINFEGAFLYGSPEESIAWLENARLRGQPFIMRYKKWHRFVRIQRLNFEMINNTHIDYQIGLRVMGFHNEDINNLILASNRASRLENFATAEMGARLAIAGQDFVNEVFGLNDLGDTLGLMGGSLDRVVNLAASAAQGLSNTMNALTGYNNSGNNKGLIVFGSASGDASKGTNALEQVAKTIDNSIKSAKISLGW